MEEKDVLGLINKALDQREERETKARQDESEKVGLAEAIKGIGGRLDAVDSKLGKIDDDFCSKFPELCTRVENVEKALSAPKVEKGTEEWKSARKADIEHILFDDCPNCTPVRDEILKAKGKTLADLEPKVAPKAEELETSPFPRKGFEWSEEKQLYAKV